MAGFLPIVMLKCEKLHQSIKRKKKWTNIKLWFRSLVLFDVLSIKIYFSNTKKRLTLFLFFIKYWINASKYLWLQMGKMSNVFQYIIKIQNEELCFRLNETTFFFLLFDTLWPTSIIRMHYCYQSSCIFDVTLNWSQFYPNELHLCALR